MKTIKHLLEEARTSASSPDKEDAVDNYRALSRKEEIPMMLVFKRQNIRNMNGIKVGLYYSPVLGKFITIPFGGKDLEQGSNLNENYNVDIFDLARTSLNTAKNVKRGISRAGSTIRNAVNDKLTSLELKHPKFQKAINPKGFENRANREIKNYVSAVQSIRKTKEGQKADPEAFRSKTKTNLRYSADSDRVEHEKTTPLTGDVTRARASVKRLTDLGIGVPVVRKNTLDARQKRQEIVAKAAQEREAAKPKKPGRTPGAVVPPSPAGPIDENAGAVAAFAWDKAKGSISKLRDFIKNKKPKNAPAAPTQPQGETSASSGQRHVAGQASRVEVNRANKDSSSAGAENYRRKSMPAFSIQESNLQKVHRLAITNGIDNTRIGFRNSRGETLVDKNQARSIAQLYESLSPKNKTKMEGMISESADTYKKVLEFALKGTMNG